MKKHCDPSDARRLRMHCDKRVQQILFAGLFWIIRCIHVHSCTVNIRIRMINYSKWTLQCGVHIQTSWILICLLTNEFVSLHTKHTIGMIKDEYYSLRVRWCRLDPIAIRVLALPNRWNSKALTSLFKTTRTVSNSPEWSSIVHARLPTFSILFSLKFPSWLSKVCNPNCLVSNFNVNWKTCFLIGICKKRPIVWLLVTG